MKIKCNSGSSKIKDLKPGTLFAFVSDDSNKLLFGLKTVNGLKDSDGDAFTAIDPKDGEPLYFTSDKEIIPFPKASINLGFESISCKTLMECC